MWLESPMRAAQTRPDTRHVQSLLDKSVGCCGGIAFLFLRFFSAVVTRSASKVWTPLCMMLLHCDLFYAVDFHFLLSTLQAVKDGFRVALKRFRCPPTERLSDFSFP